MVTEDCSLHNVLKYMKADNMGFVSEETQNKRLSFFEKLGYKPFRKQKYLHSLDYPNLLLAGGVRFSKSWWTSYEASFRIMDRFFEGYTGDLYWLIGKDYSMTKAEWQYMISIFRDMDLLHPSTTKFNGDSGKSSRMFIGFKNTPIEDCITIETISADVLEKISRFAPMGIIVAEAAQNSESLYFKCIERLTQTRKHGSWLIMEGTFEGSLGWYPQLFERWRNGNENEKAISVSCPSWENEVEFPEGKDDPAIRDAQQRMTEQEFSERYGGEPCPPKGSVMADSFRFDIHVSAVETYYDPDDDVYLAHDPGIAHAAAALAIQVRKDYLGEPQVCVIDEVYTKGLGVNEFIDIVLKKSWFENVNQSRSVIDQAGSFKNFGGDPIVKQWRDKTGINFRYNKVPIKKSSDWETGVDLLKRFCKVHPITGRPNLFVNPKCRGLISEWGGCANPISGQSEVWCWKTDAQGNPIGLAQIFDDSSKALIYYLWDFFGYADKRKNKGPNVPIRRLTEAAYANY